MVRDVLSRGNFTRHCVVKPKILKIRPIECLLPALSATRRTRRVTSGKHETSIGNDKADQDGEGIQLEVSHPQGQQEYHSSDLEHGAFEYLGADGSLSGNWVVIVTRFGDL